MKMLLFLSLLLYLPAQVPPVVQLGPKVITLTISADGTKPFSYQWYRNEVKIAGQTTDTLLITNATATGTYKCIISNSVGSTTSPTIQLNNTSVATAPDIQIVRKQK